MKIKRYKHARKIISFYKTHFGLREPYQILVDGTFCQAALRGKILIKEQLPKYLGGNIQLVTTRCILNELQSLGDELKGAYYIANRFQQRRCGHKKHLPAAECINDFIGVSNDHHYCIATQDLDLKHNLKERPGIPLLHIVRNTVVLESPSNASTSKANQVSDDKLNPSKYEQSVITKLNQTTGTNEVTRRKKRRYPKGPNPLSVKKRSRQSKPDQIVTDRVSLSKKRRLRLQKRRAIEQLALSIQTKS